MPLLTGYAQWWHLLLIFGGLAFVAFEIFVFPGHFVSAIVGGIMVLGGLLLTFVGDAPSTAPDGWRLPGTWAVLEPGVYVIAGGLFCSVLLSLWLRRYLPRLPYFNGLILTTTSGGGTLAADPVHRLLPSVAPAAAASSFEDTAAMVDRWPFVGTSGHAISDLKPGGSAAFPYANDTRTTAVVSDGDYIVAGTKVVVREVRGGRVVVQGISA